MLNQRCQTTKFIERGYILHVHLITAEDGIIRRCHEKVEAEGLGYQSAPANKNTTVNLLEYGTSLTRWIVTLILCNDSCRLKSTKLSNERERATPPLSRDSTTPRPLNACCAQRILPLGRPQVHSAPFPANVRCYMG